LRHGWLYLVAIIDWFSRYVINVYLADYGSPRDARQGIGQYFSFYNTERPHQALDYRRPAELYVERLSQGPASVSDLAKPLGITLAAVVQHLQVLERSGVVHTEKVGRVRRCRIEPTGLDLAANWIAERHSLWERRLDRLGDILAEEEQPTRRATKNRGKS
jgi:DNA-binding transcriptional ArsR family regulator